MLFVGQEIYGYCQGYFGRDFFGGMIEAVGHDWIVARSHDNKYPAFASFPGGLGKFPKLIEDMINPNNQMFATK